MMIDDGFTSLLFICQQKSAIDFLFPSFRFSKLERERERESANTELVYSEKSQNASCKENSPDWFLCEGSRSTTDSIIMFIHFGDLFSEKSNHTATTSKSSTSSSTVVVLYTHKPTTSLQSTA
jgi:hypothetical protein